MPGHEGGIQFKMSVRGLGSGMFRSLHRPILHREMASDAVTAGAFLVREIIPLFPLG